MTDIEIPEEAVEKAARASYEAHGYMSSLWAWESLNEAEKSYRLRRTRAALEAALPALRPVLAAVSVEDLAIELHSFDGWAIESGESWADCSEDRQSAFRYQAEALLETRRLAVSRERLAEVLQESLRLDPYRGPGVVLSAADHVIASGVVQDEATLRRQWAEEVAPLMADLTDRGECWFDHHGYCQEHGWSETEPACPHARAKTLLREYGGSKP